MNRKEIGYYCEKAAADYLKKSGFEILERNFRYGKIAEIDIIAVKDSEMHIIEVKARSGKMFGSPSEAVNFRKIINIKKAAEYYIQKSNSYDKDINFDVIEIYFSKSIKDDTIYITDINMIYNAF